MSMLLVALLTFVFSLSGLWGRSSDQRLFNQHVDAVTRHLESMVHRAALPAVGAWQSEPFSWQEIGSTSDGTFTALSFTLADGDRSLAWGGTLAPLVICALNVAPSRGLVLYWHSSLEEDQDTWHEQPVSPLLTGLSYNYFNPDAGTWRSETTPEKTTRGAAIVPDQIVLHFTYAKLKAGASAVQLYTLLVFRGAGLVQAIKRDLAQRLKADGFTSVAEAVGAR